MRIKRSNFLGLAFSGDGQYSKIREDIYQDRLREIKKLSKNAEDVEKYSNDVASLLSQDGNKNYLMTQSSMGIIDGIKIDEGKIDGKVFKGLPLNKKITILAGERTFFRYHVKEDNIFCISVNSKPVNDTHNEISYVTFRINTKDGTFSENLFQDWDRGSQIGMRTKGKFMTWFTMFLKALIYLEFSELDTVILKNGSKHGTKKAGKYLNESGEEVVVVDSTWNKTIIRVGEFGVSGHLRLQPFGKGRTNRKLIYVSDYMKKGYVRNAKKQVVNG